MANTQNRSDNSQAKKPSAASRRSSKSGPGRGWHGDSEGHARAGSQSHKNK